MYHIKTFFLVAVLGLALTGCSTIKELKVFSKAVERQPLNLIKPEAAKMEDIKWIIITSENAEEVFAKLKEQGKDPVLFGLTGDGYESLAKNFAQIRAYMLKQDAIINEYKQYYEPKKSLDTNK
jgi:ADP-heptose:LPS heptosyltransferase